MKEVHYLGDKKKQGPKPYNGKNVRKENDVWIFCYRKYGRDRIYGKNEVSKFNYHEYNKEGGYQVISVLFYKKMV